jgi:hypothetical protein
VLSYRVTLDVPVQLVLFVSGLLADRRREIGTRRGTHALTCFRQAVFVLAWFRDRPDIRRLGQGSGISQATAYRYLTEAVEAGRPGSVPAPGAGEGKGSGAAVPNPGRHGGRVRPVYGEEDQQEGQGD